MKIIPSVKVRGLILAAAFSAGLGFGTHASAQTYLIDLNSKTVTALDTLGLGGNIPQGINDAGQVTGYYFPAFISAQAFITGPDGMGMRDLGSLGGTYAAAHGINNAGQVVGVSETDDIARAFITGPNGMDMRDLGTFRGSNSASGINDAGQVVGFSFTAGGARLAFITGPDGAGMMDLNSLVDLPPGIILTAAMGINNSGQVIALGGMGTIPAIPEPEISALFLAGLALVGFMARRRKMGGKTYRFEIRNGMGAIPSRNTTAVQAFLHWAADKRFVAIVVTLLGVTF